MARKKIEALHHWRKTHPLALRERLIAYLPRYAVWGGRLAPLLNLRDTLPGLAGVSERLLGFSAKRSLPRWRSDWFRDSEVVREPTRRGVLRLARTAPDAATPTAGEREQCGAGAEHHEVLLLADTFNRYFEPENLRAAIAVLRKAGYRVHLARAPQGEKPLCCGRTFLSQGLVEEARFELRRVLAAVEPYIERGIPVIGLEPSCLFTLRDELLALVPAAEVGRVSLDAYLFEEFLDGQAQAGRLRLPLRALPQRQALLHGHCHQKAFDVMPNVERVLRLVPGLAVESVVSSCCGMAGAFGYEADHYEVSMRMAEAALLPRVRAAGEDTLLVADGTSCRHQIRDGAGREARHVALVLQAALD
jgi:Fe-S oxidoreductase